MELGGQAAGSRGLWHGAGGTLRPARVAPGVSNAISACVVGNAANAGRDGGGSGVAGTLGGRALRGALASGGRVVSDLSLARTLHSQRDRLARPDWRGSPRIMGLRRGLPDDC